MTEYVATRWYRAPEIMLSFKMYTKVGSTAPAFCQTNNLMHLIVIAGHRCMGCWLHSRRTSHRTTSLPRSGLWSSARSHSRCDRHTNPGRVLRDYISQIKRLHPRASHSQTPSLHCVVPTCIHRSHRLPVENVDFRPEKANNSRRSIGAPLPFIIREPKDDKAVEDVANALSVIARPRR